MLLHWDATDWELCGPQASPYHAESEERTILAPATHSSTAMGKKLWPRQHHNINCCPSDEQKYVIIILIGILITSEIESLFMSFLGHFYFFLHEYLFVYFLLTCQNFFHAMYIILI